MAWMSIEASSLVEVRYLVGIPAHLGPRFRDSACKAQARVEQTTLLPNGEGQYRRDVLGLES